MPGLKVAKALGLSLAVTVLLTGLDLIGGQQPVVGRSAWRFAFALGALLLGWLGQPGEGRRGWLRPLSVTGIALGLGVLCSAQDSPGMALAWAALSVGCGALIALDGVFQAAFCTFGRPWVRRTTSWAMRLLLAGLGGLMPVALAQINTGFAEEEFFALVQGLLLAGVVFLLLSGFAVLRLGPDADISARREKDRIASLAPLRVFAVLLAAALTGGLAWLGARTLTAYRASFAPVEAPGYPGISADSPFLCGQVPSAEGTPSGQDVYERALRQVEIWPDRGARELALLALSSGDTAHAEAFRQAVLAKAQSSAFTGPTHSLKWAQFDAALWLYFTALVREAFPDLFPADEWTILEEWFTAINERAWRVEWVDVLYGLAFGQPPDGPYENQEIGAGLLALLEAEGMAAPEWSAANRDYLARSGLGWLRRFRNPDDAYFYQAVWIQNALFQSLIDGTSAENQRLSYEWLLLQALPDGESLRYNHPDHLPLVAIWYQAARLLGDGRYVWLADRSLSKVEQENDGLMAAPGLEAPISLQGRSPTTGSCLIYGDSGLPLQPGPQAPDKIVFRDGWQHDAAYLLLNLRFTGWHRYKATNAVIQVYQDGPLVIEGSQEEPVRWLPLGRQAFRDKRILRENLNGLLIPRSGLDGAIQTLTGLGSPWAQDPPHYAEVETFQAMGPLDVSRTTLRHWRGWTHVRSVYFVRDGPIVVVDDARSDPARSGAALIWHLVGEGRREADGLWLRSGKSPARMALPTDAWAEANVQPGSQNGENGVSVVYSSPQEGELHLATAFLTGDWATADFDVYPLTNGAGQAIQISGQDGEYRILHNGTGGWLEADGLATDGLAVAGWWPTEGGQGWLCYVEATRVQVDDTQVLATDGPALSNCMTLEAAIESGSR